MTALVDTKQECIDHIVNRLFLITILKRIGPDCCLLRSKCRSGICCDGCIVAVVLLIRGGLDTVSCKHCIIGTQTAAGTVFDHQLRILLKYTVKPLQVCPFMLQHPLSDTVRIKLGTNSRLNIIIHLDIIDTILIHHTVNDLIDMINDCRITEVKLISAAVVDSFPMADKEPVIRNALCLLAVNSHNLKL